MGDPNSELLARLEQADYYAILGAEPGAHLADLKRGFYRIALRYHPDRYEGEDPDVCAVRARIYKLAVEAYTVLSKSSTRKQYDELRSAGHKRLDSVAAFEHVRAPKERTLAEIATNPKAKSLAQQADDHLKRNELEDARGALLSACRHDPNNRSLKERLTALYEALEAEGS